MRTTTLVAFTLFNLLCSSGFTQALIMPEIDQDLPEIRTNSKQKLNFFIISKRKKGKLDPATRFNTLRAKIKSSLRPKNFVAIVASDAETAKSKMIFRLQKHNATIGTLWFDSHGMYKKGYSLFFIGHDEISYNSLANDSLQNTFRQLTEYMTNNTRLVIGSCYGGATYSRSSVDYKDTTRMNGDSLMISLGKIFTSAKIYGSESWVMTKPGIFNNHKPAVAGYPKRKLFRDVCYQPAWENVGKWNEFDAQNGVFRPVNAVVLDSYGNLEIDESAYQDKDETKRNIRKNLSKLELYLYK